MKPDRSQFNIRIPNKLKADLIDFCWTKGWKVELACIDFLKLELLVAKYPEIHEQMDKVIEASQLVNVENPDYVSLAVKQFDDIEKAIDLKKNLKLIPVPLPQTCSAVYTHKELEV